MMDPKRDVHPRPGFPCVGESGNDAWQTMKMRDFPFAGSHDVKKVKLSPIDEVISLIGEASKIKYRLSELYYQLQKQRKKGC